MSGIVFLQSVAQSDHVVVITSSAHKNLDELFIRLEMVDAGLPPDGEQMHADFTLG